jgi:hypothetical protein
MEAQLYGDSQDTLLLLLFGGDLEAGILSQSTGQFPGVHVNRTICVVSFIVLATRRNQSTPFIHMRTVRVR